MKVKNKGALIELDPNKEYIMLIEASMMSEEQVTQIKAPLNGKVIYAHNIMKGIKFVENSNKIVGIKYLKHD